MGGLRSLLLFASGLALASGTCPVHAAKVYKWTDRNGVTHYGDHVPQNAAATQSSRISVIPVRAEPSAIARLRVERAGERYLAWADNTLSGPIEVALDFNRADNVAGSPHLPMRKVIPPRGTLLVSTLSVSDPSRGGDFELAMESVPGDPAARPRNVDYLLPLRQSQFRIDQGFGGSFSHSDPQNRYAVDFAAPVGTPVLAARAGLVMQVESDFERAGLNQEKYGGRANFVRILHEDGSMGLYAHLKSEGVQARVGQRVVAGQQIGLSGNTGFTTGPHLHFVIQVNRGMRLESIPFRMTGPQGPLRIAGNR
ncbi:peptidoglycan DD-metalloendopeptidase family protein [Aerolutibacter ruishenii]|uniref:Murein DD-endopeptidase MepM/ murein hydrolase activator NlpD n=1 Tax=Aerolutibacter ruishenii TaxID=686800 RepID=A0A562LP77_9GAMM|nr:peptidoglycan DD-metalloendopeptidase family protein [Lysobacter ruishenii]TWI09431.1 murein DD-endopeptidase MepM/ murein hydrolase activator NlpD [Lysobacter ruishenii]